MNAPDTPAALLDRPAARIAALGVALLCAVVLAFIHRDDLFPPDTAMAEAGTDPVALCMAERAAEVDRMVAEGIVDETRAALFKSRAEAMCQDTLGSGNSAPPPRRQ